MAMLVKVALLVALAVVASSDVNQTTEQEVSSLLSVTSGEETRRVSRLEAEVEILRRSVTELKAAGPCATQQRSLEADALSVAQEVRGLRHHVQSLRMHSELSAIRSELQSLRSRLPSDVTEEVRPLEAVPRVDERLHNVSVSSASAGSVYTRWGSGQCPLHAQLVYSGAIAGSHFTHEGAASNALCLPLNPVFENYVRPSDVMWIYGAEYKVSNHNSNNLDPKCAVCHVARAAAIMVPATNSCYTGWTLEYTGILMAGFPSHKAATEFICVDSALEGLTGTNNSKDGKLLYYVLSACNDLPCPPYIHNKTTEQEVSSLLFVTSGEGARRVSRLEAEVERLRRSVTEMKAAGPATQQRRFSFFPLAGK